MAWTAPATFVDGTALTAAQLNTYLRDNFLETAPAKATTSGYHFVSTGANQIAERPIQTASVSTNETCSITSFGDLATVGPSITCTTGTKALIFMAAYLESPTNIARASYQVSGASTIAADTTWALYFNASAAGQGMRAATSRIETGLTAGVNTFKMVYQVDTGSATIGARELIVIGL